MLKLEDAVPGTRIRVIRDTTLANKDEVAVIEEVKVYVMLVVKFDEDEYTTNFDFNVTATDFEVVK